jgi:hypothetical protein
MNYAICDCALISEELIFRMVMLRELPYRRLFFHGILYAWSGERICDLSAWSGERICDLSAWNGERICDLCASSGERICDLCA